MPSLPLNKQMYVVYTADGTFITDAGLATVERWQDKYLLERMKQGRCTDKHHFSFTKVPVRGRASKRPWRCI